MTKNPISKLEMAFRALDEIARENEAISHLGAEGPNTDLIKSTQEKLTQEVREIAQNMKVTKAVTDVILSQEEIGDFVVGLQELITEGIRLQEEKVFLQRIKARVGKLGSHSSFIGSNRPEGEKSTAGGSIKAVFGEIGDLVRKIRRKEGRETEVRPEINKRKGLLAALRSLESLENIEGDLPSEIEFEENRELFSEIKRNIRDIHRKYKEKIEKFIDGFLDSAEGKVLDECKDLGSSLDSIGFDHELIVWSKSIITERITCLEVEDKFTRKQEKLAQLMQKNVWEQSGALPLRQIVSMLRDMAGIPAILGEMEALTGSSQPTVHPKNQHRVDTLNQGFQEEQEGIESFLSKNVISKISMITSQIREEVERLKKEYATQSEATPSDKIKVQINEKLPHESDIRARLETLEQIGWAALAPEIDRISASWSESLESLNFSIQRTPLALFDEENITRIESLMETKKQSDAVMTDFQAKKTETEEAISSLSALTEGRIGEWEAFQAEVKEFLDSVKVNPQINPKSFQVPGHIVVNGMVSFSSLNLDREKIDTRLANGKRWKQGEQLVLNTGAFGWGCDLLSDIAQQSYHLLPGSSSAPGLEEKGSANPLQEESPEPSLAGSRDTCAEDIYPDTYLDPYIVELAVGNARAADAVNKAVEVAAFAGQKFRDRLREGNNLRLANPQRGELKIFRQKLDGIKGEKDSFEVAIKTFQDTLTGVGTDLFFTLPLSDLSSNFNPDIYDITPPNQADINLLRHKAGEIVWRLLEDRNETGLDFPPELDVEEIKSKGYNNILDYYLVLKKSDERGERPPEINTIIVEQALRKAMLKQLRLAAAQVDESREMDKFTFYFKNFFKMVIAMGNLVQKEHLGFHSGHPYQNIPRGCEKAVIWEDADRRNAA